MKTIAKYAAFIIAAVGMVSCGDLYETHEEYLKMGEEVYVGKADSLEANGGFNRVELRWQLNADPKIATCEISWNGCTEPVVVEADRSQKVMSTIIDLKEGNYIFSIVVKSASGKKSLAQTISGTSYGENYQGRLVQRSISSVEATPEGATINWLPEEGCVAVTIEYTNNKGEHKVVRTDGETSSTFIDDYVPGSEYTVTSFYKPELYAIDEIPVAEPTVKKFPSFYTLSKADWEENYHAQYTDLDRSDWTVTANTEETSDMPASAVLDGDMGSFWHSEWRNGATPALPHELIIDMKEENAISSVELAHRADIKTIVFSISHDSENWTEMGELTFTSSESSVNKVLLLPESVKGRYIRALVTESNRATHSSIFEIFFFTPTPQE